MKKENVEKFINAITSIANIASEEMEELAKEHWDESRLDSWDDDEAFGKYTAYSDCRKRLLHALKTYT